MTDAVLLAIVATVHDWGVALINNWASGIAATGVFLTVLLQLWNGFRSKKAREELKSQVAALDSRVAVIHETIASGAAPLGSK